jgi:hypothetical protein
LEVWNLPKLPELARINHDVLVARQAVNRISLPMCMQQQAKASSPKQRKSVAYPKTQNPNALAQRQLGGGPGEGQKFYSLA